MARSTQPPADDDATPITGTYGAMRARTIELQLMRIALDRIARTVLVLYLVVGAGVSFYVWHWLVTGR